MKFLAAFLLAGTLMVPVFPGILMAIWAAILALEGAQVS